MREDLLNWAKNGTKLTGEESGYILTVIKLTQKSILGVVYFIVGLRANQRLYPILGQGHPGVTLTKQ